MRPQTAAATVAFLVLCLILALFAAHVAEAIYLLHEIKQRSAVEVEAMP